MPAQPHFSFFIFSEHEAMVIVAALCTADENRPLLWAQSRFCELERALESQASLSLVSPSHSKAETFDSSTIRIIFVFLLVLCQQRLLILSELTSAAALFSAGYLLIGIVHCRGVVREQRSLIVVNHQLQSNKWHVVRSISKAAPQVFLHIRGQLSWCFLL